MQRTTVPHVKLVSLIAVALVLLGTTLAGAQVGDTRVLFDCDSLDDVSIMDGEGMEATELALNTDEQFVSEGDASLHLSGVSPADATGNSYLSMAIDIDPIDLEGEALQLDSWTDLTAITRAL
jgi:hypothetical protein